MGTYTKIVTIQVEQTFEDEHHTIVEQRVIDGNKIDLPRPELIPIIKRQYVIGIRRRIHTDNKVPELFVIKSNNFKSLEEPHFQLIKHINITATYAKAIALAKDMLEEYKTFILNQNKEKEKQEQDRNKQIRQKLTGTLRRGEVVLYVDEGEKEHFAIIINPGKNVSKMLFVTSTQSWNDHSRRMTEEERMLTGMVFRCSISFFAPVVRPNAYVNKFGNCYPKHRVEKLEQEFFRRG